MTFFNTFLERLRIFIFIDYRNPSIKKERMLGRQLRRTLLLEK